MKNITTIFFAPTESFFKKQVHLPPDESHHLVKVLRFSVDDQFVVTDGCGKAHIAKVVKADSKRVLGEIMEDAELPPLSGELPVRVAVAVGIIKPKRFERLISPISQMGATEIVPVICKYSDPSNIKRIEGEQFFSRLDNMARNAAKGSLRTHFPIFYKPIELLDMLNLWRDRRLFFGDPEGLPTLPGFKDDEKKDILIIIGPEGGFSHREVETMRGFNAVPISLGRTRLRTENAIVAMIVKTLCGVGLM